MASYKDVYNAEFFKKDKVEKPNIDINDSVEPNSLPNDRNRKLSSVCDDGLENKYNNGSSDSDSSTEDDDDFDEEFNNEDRLISILYRKVVDDIMQVNKLRESQVNAALDNMKLEIFQGHKKGFRRFSGINFNKPKNCCGYLRRYAICHTGLVKKIMWKFLKNNKVSILSLLAKNDIMHQNHLSVVSLGGGPGNDLIGFCSAIQELTNSVKEIDLYVIDICEGWKTVLPKIMKQAVKDNFGSFTEYLKKVKISTAFLAADLTAKGVFQNEVSSCLDQADVVLMVKLTSFLPDTEAGDLIRNVVDCMKPAAKLIFIDHPYDRDFFQKIKNLMFIYHDYVKYELSFKPAKYQSPSIDSTQAHVGIYEKIESLEDGSKEES